MNLEIGKAIKKLRTDKGIKQEELADYIGISFQAVSKWENDVTTPDISLLPKLAIFFGVTIDDLFSVGDTDHYKRIDHMLNNEHTITDENYIYSKRFLDARLKEDENDVETLKRYASLYLHRINREKLAAGEYLERAIHAAPFDKQIGSSIYDLASVRGTDERFIRFLEAFSADYPTQSKAKEKLVELYISKRYFTKARDLINDLLQTNKNLLYKLYQGDLTLAEGDEDNARIIWFDTARALENSKLDSFQLYYEIGKRFENVTDYTHAEIYYLKHFKTHDKPRPLDSLFHLAFMYNNLGKYKKAIEIWELILKYLKEDWDIAEGESVDWPLREIANLKTKIQ